MDINKAILQIDDPSFYSESFIAVLEDHMTYLRTHPQTKIVEVPIAYSVRNVSDNISMLMDMGYPLKYHFAILRLNNIISMTEHKEKLTHLLIPSFDELERINNTHKTKQKRLL